MAVSGGDDWNSVWHALADLWLFGLPSYFFQYQFLLVHAFIVLLVFNVVTAIIIDSTFQRANTVRDFVIHQQISREQHFCKTMQEVFNEIDGDCSGLITKD